MDARPDPDILAALRQPPHSIEAEQSVLGGLLLVNEAWDRVGDILVESDFYRHEHRLVFSAVAELISTNRPADVITVFEHLQNLGKGQEAGGLSYLDSLAQSMTGAANLRRYAEIVRSRAVMRKLIVTADQIGTAAYNPQGRSVDDILDEAQEAVMRISEERGRFRGGFQSIESLVVGVLDRVQELAEKGGTEIIGTPTGFYDLDRKTTGMQPGNLIILAARPSMGKALSHEAKLLTPAGWVRMGDIQVGNRVVGRDGRAYSVTGVYPQGSKTLYRVVFDDGGSTTCCDDHLWFTSSRADRKAGRGGKVRTLSEIRATLRVGGRDARLSHQIPWVQPMHLTHTNHAQLPIDPYLLGLWLGDGSITGGCVRFHNSEPDLVERFNALLGPADTLSGSGNEWRVKRVQRNNQRSALSNALRDLRLLGMQSHTKFVPQRYLWTAAENRLALLRGLLDTDGYCYGAGIEYTTASEKLADAVRFLVRSLGGRVTTVVRPTSFDYRGEKRAGRLSHRMVISFDSDIVPVSSDKHLAAFTGVSRRTGRYITEVVPIGVGPAQCISVAAPDGLFVTDDFIVTHNTAFALNIVEHVAVREQLPVAVFSLEMGASSLAVRLVASIGRIDQQNMRTGKLGDFEWSYLSTAVEQLRNTNIVIDETPAVGIGYIRAAALRQKRIFGQMGLLVVDYLQLMSGPGGSDENRATEIGDISRGLKSLAKELQCPVLALSQLNRGVDARSDKRPVMSDLRESGAIEQDADVILFIYRDDYYNKDSADPGIAEIIIGKQREGPTGTVKLVWLAPNGRFDNLSPDYVSPSRQKPSKGKKEV